MKSIKDLMNLNERVALITGGAGHIGSCIGEALAEMGANIAILDMDKKKCDAVTQKIKNKYSVNTLSLPVDLTDEKAIRTVPEKAIDKFGRLDILVNCAALVGTSELKGWAVPFKDQHPDTWRLALDINLTAPFILIQACTDALKTSGHGSIINLSSIYGVVGPNMGLYEDTKLGNPAAYAASKGGLNQFTKWLAINLAPEIRVNTISPGGIFRDHKDPFLKKFNKQTPLGRMATEEDLKGAAVYLASDLSAYVTGQNLIVDGGWTVW